MKSRSRLVLGLALGPWAAATLLASGAAAANDGPAAIVERIEAPSSAIEAFDYLWPGDQIDLGADSILVLGYLTSCRRETIVGGQVKVGLDQSETDSQMIHHQKVPCDPIVASLTSAQASESGAVILRDPEEEALKAQQSIRIYSTAPVFSTPEPVTQIVVRRLDQSVPDMVLQPAGAVLDTAGSAVTFAPGGRYEARAGEILRIFEIDPTADLGDGPAVGRLISF